MADRDAPPTDLLDAHARLTDIAEWLAAEGYGGAAANLRVTAAALLICVRVTVPDGLFD